MLAEFEMFTPKTLLEALDLLALNQSHTALVAGGTNLVVDLRSGRHTPEVVINIDRLSELRGIHQSDGQIVIGGLTTINELIDSPIIREVAPNLFFAAKMFANPIIRNRATVGGNLADASPAGDTIPPFLALDAEVELVSYAGSRWVPLDAFFMGVRKTVIKENELLSAVRFTVPDKNTRHAYYKLGLRKADAISVISVAVSLEISPNNVCKKARIALGSVAPRPLRAKEAESQLEGKEITPGLAGEAAKLAVKAVSPISDIRGSADYRRKMVDVLVRRLLLEAVENRE